MTITRSTAIRVPGSDIIESTTHADLIAQAINSEDFGTIVTAEVFAGGLQIDATARLQTTVGAALREAEYFARGFIAGKGWK